MQMIIERLLHDDEFLSPLLQTSYFSWQHKYLQVLVTLGNALIPRVGSWQIRDIILLFKNEIPKVHLVAALMKHSQIYGNSRYLLNEKEIYQIGELISRPEGDFVKDVNQMISSMPCEINEKIKHNFTKFVTLTDPHRFALIPSVNLLHTSETNFWQHSFVAPLGLNQGNTVLESVGMSVQLNPAPLIPIFKSISDYISNHVKLATSLNYSQNLPKGISTPKITEIIEE
jgi:hypothetical protein